MGGAAGVILLVAVVAAVVAIIRRCLRLQGLSVYNTHVYPLYVKLILFHAYIHLAEKAKSSFKMKENTAYEIVNIQHVHSRAIDTTLETDPVYETIQ